MIEKFDFDSTRFHQKHEGASYVCTRSFLNILFMLGNISWLEYLIFISAAALTWYAAVFYIYYRHDLLQSLHTKKTHPSAGGKISNFNLEDIAGIDHKNFQTSPDISQIIQSFSDEVAAYLEEAGKNEVVKEDLLLSLGRISGKYPSLASSEYKESLDQFIKIQSETYCAMFLSEEDLNKVWGGT
jgi:hypothetical protein